MTWMEQSAPAVPSVVTATNVLQVHSAAALTGRVAPHTGIYDVMSSWTSKDGKTVALRRAAYDKITTKHNLTTAVVKRATKSCSSRLRAGSPTAFNYFLEATQISCGLAGCQVLASLWVQSTVDYRAISGGTFSVVTTYYQGVTWCPNWVKNALNV